MRLALFFWGAASLGSIRRSGREIRSKPSELMAAGQFEQAIPIYRQLVKAVPGNPACC